jgi:hypothetical protein
MPGTRACVHDAASENSSRRQQSPQREVFFEII